MQQILLTAFTVYHADEFSSLRTVDYLPLWGILIQGSAELILGRTGRKMGASHRLSTQPLPLISKESQSNPHLQHCSSDQYGNTQWKNSFVTSTCFWSFCTQNWTFIVKMLQTKLSGKILCPYWSCVFIFCCILAYESKKQIYIRGTCLGIGGTPCPALSHGNKTNEPGPRLLNELICCYMCNP